MMPQFYPGDAVEANIGGKRIIGSIRTRTYGWPPRKIEPEYGILPEGEMSLAAMITVRETEIRKIV